MKNIKNIKMTIAYDGTNYFGWQRQKDKQSIQGIIENKIKKLSGEMQLKLYGSGRTDARVHAFGQVANFFTKSSIPLDKWPIILNHQLPGDIRIIDAKKVNMGFHARYSAKSKIYRYYIINRMNGLRTFTAKDAFLRNYCYYYHKQLDIQRMRNATNFLIGHHDFSALSCFNQKKSEFEQNKIRNIKNITITKKGEVICFSIEADAFLYKMVRIIVGTLMDFSSGQREPEEIKQIFETNNNQKSGRVLPPQGLYLMKVKYK